MRRIDADELTVLNVADRLRRALPPRVRPGCTERCSIDVCQNEFELLMKESLKRCVRNALVESGTITPRDRVQIVLNTRQSVRCADVTVSAVLPVCSPRCT